MNNKYEEYKDKFEEYKGTYEKSKKKDSVSFAEYGWISCANSCKTPGTIRDSRKITTQGRYG
jgi:hypothetical protein